MRVFFSLALVVLALSFSAQVPGAQASSPHARNQELAPASKAAQRQAQDLDRDGRISQAERARAEKTQRQSASPAKSPAKNSPAAKKPVPDSQLGSAARREILKQRLSQQKKTGKTVRPVTGRR